MGPSRRLIEIAAGVEAVVVVAPEQAAVERVGAALRHHVHDRAGRAAVLRGKLVGHQPNLLDDVGVVHRLLAPGDARVVDVLAVDHDVFDCRRAPFEE